MGSPTAVSPRLPDILQPPSERVLTWDTAINLQALKKVKRGPAVSTAQVSMF